LTGTAGSVDETCAGEDGAGEGRGAAGVLWTGTSAGVSSEARNAASCALRLDEAVELAAVDPDPWRKPSRLLSCIMSVIPERPPFPDKGRRLNTPDPAGEFETIAGEAGEKIWAEKREAAMRTMQNPRAIAANSARRFPIRPFRCRSRKRVLFRTRKRALTVPIMQRIRAMMGTVRKPAGPFDPTGDSAGSRMVRTIRIAATSANGASVTRKDRTEPIILPELNGCEVRTEAGGAAIS